MKFKDLFNEDWSVNWEKIIEIPQFDKLMSTKQSAVWHKEGNVYLHTILVTQEMEKLLNRNLVVVGSPAWVMCMAAALCHDLGKADTTKWSDEKNDWTTKNHGIVGERITRSIFYDEDIVLREKVCYMVRHHMALHHIYDKPELTNKRFIKLSHGIVPMNYMILLNIADSLGSYNDIETEDFIYDKEMRLTNDISSLRCYQKPYSLVEKSQLIRDFIDYEGKVVNNSNDFCIYILCGFPGAGKTTYRSKFLSDKKVVSRDIVRCDLHICGATPENDKKVIGSKKDEERVTEICNKQILEYCENKESFVYDNLNIKSRYRHEFLRSVMKYNPLIKIIYIEAYDIDTCVERRKNDIPKNAYNRFANDLDFPQLYECNELIIVKQHSDGTDETHIFNGDFVPNLADDICSVNGKDYISKSKILNDLKITRGAMILDGYDCYDSCIKYMNELINNYESIADYQELFGERPLKND